MKTNGLTVGMALARKFSPRPRVGTARLLVGRP